MLLSLKAYMDTTSHKMLDIGSGWPRKVAKALPADYDLSVFDKSGMAYPLVGMCPTDDDPQGLIDWLRDLPVGTLYEMILSVLKDPARLPPDLSGLRKQYVAALQIWHDHYFSTLDPAIHETLRNNVSTAAAVIRSLPPDEAVEQITGGIVLELDPGIEAVLLVPQYHYRPFNIFDCTDRTLMIAYPAELPSTPTAVPSDLRNLTRALADDSRLQILRFLSGGERNFTEIVKFSGLAKSTVHHHMVILRVSGLVRVHMKRTVADRYSLRPAAIDRIGPRLHAFLKEE
ncbi:MAG: transcriptional regulator, ArsR family [Symbiobacteriaceae bacterium]|jgi:DNA-binding transcriptional ArsR family regulator|nr:transcriptional regulator, ArsR family [Symbiobacteriaceae bacterium]